MRNIKLAAPVNFLSADSVPTDSKPAPAAVPAASAKPSAPAVAPAAAPADGAPAIAAPHLPAPRAESALPNKHVVRMQNEMFRLREAFFSSSVKGKDGKTVPSWDTFASSMFQRHLDHNESKKSVSLIDKLESITLIGAPLRGQGPTAAKADGRWGKNTNTALSHIHDLANMMLTVAGKFQIHLNFSAKDVKELQNTKASDERADEITEVLSNITNSVDTFITEVEKNMMKNRENGELQAGYDGKKEFTKATFPGIGGIQLSSKQFPAPRALSHLFTQESLSEFITANKLNIDVKNNEALVNYLISLEEGINSGAITVSMGADPNKTLQTSR